MAATSIADQLKVLIELQKLDGQIYRLRRELSEKPAESARLKEEHAARSKGVKDAEAASKTMELKKTSKEGDLAQKEQQIKKLQAQLFAVKTNKEYSAMQTEIGGLKADQSVLEEEILKLMEEVDRSKAQVAAEKEKLKGEEAALNGKLAALDQETKQFKSEIEKLHSLRSELAPKVDAPALALYERILERKEGSALVPVRGTACSGCNMVLPPQAYNEVMMNTRLIPCESCARILYIEPAS